MAFPNFDTTTATWQRRTLRYLGIYLVLALLLVAARYFTQDIRPHLREVQRQEAALQTQRDDLEVRVQAASSPQKVQQWAVQNGLQRFAEKAASATTRDLGAGEAPPETLTPSSTPAIEVKTQWK
ncbi:hypothetical protein D3875_15600 [Deinococcus cavernae]|uniref:Cell division protein FtsL n=2 Tax=Deinococcus TaxID=1298 RepID=A0A418V9F7_9DEIO|nr:hypothetical protein D3875_15600 [Deinococcus cavernae]